MDRLDRITKLQFAGFFAYFITLFLPINYIDVFGDRISAPMSQFFIGPLIVSAFIVLTLAIMFLKLLNEKFFRIAYYVATGFMILLLLFTIINPDGNDYYFTLLLQAVIITYLLLALFKKDVILTVMDKVREFSNTIAEAIIKLGNGELADVFKAQQKSEDSQEVFDGEFTDY